MMQAASRESLARSGEALNAVAADASTDLGRVGDELFAVARLADTDLSLRHALTDPARTRQDRAALVDTVFTGRVSEPTVRVMRALAEGRWSATSDLVDATKTLANLAVLTQAERDGVVEAVEDQVFRFGRILADAPQLRAAFADPSLPDDRKRGLLDRLLEGKAHAHAVTLITQALRDSQLSADEALAHVSNVAARRRERVVARVRSAVPLTEEQLDRLSAALERDQGHPVRLHVEVDPSVVGGLAVQIAGDLYDATIARRLEQARRRLVG